MKKYRLSMTVLAAVLLGLIITGCGIRTSLNGVPEEMAAAGSSRSDGGYTMAAKYAMNEMDAVEEMADEDILAYEDSYSTSSSASQSIMDSIPETEEGLYAASQGESEAIQAEKLVYTGSLTVETTEFSATLTRIRQTITQMGGFIESENDSDDAYGWYMDGYRKSSSSLSSYIQARIPSEKFYEFLDQMEGEGSKVINRSVSVQNISRQYSETATSIESLKIQERRLLDMMEEATRVSDMLEIEARLSEVQESLKQYQNALSGMDTDVAYSTVSISLREVGIYSRPEATSFREKITEAFSDGLTSFVEGVQNFCIWLAENILSILVFLFLIWLGVKLIRKMAARRKRKKEQKKQQ